MRGITVIDFITVYHVKILNEKNSKDQHHRFRKKHLKKFPTYL